MLLISSAEKPLAAPNATVFLTVAPKFKPAEYTGRVGRFGVGYDTI
ncbi:hypothetical protein FTUN_6305 [Frigoriglobus tundricola]|uniref:Uncharacterized protein n=1 Tax=Frigoriglobus tundricola TaxID=2774151 RepID=A0A6M5YZ33_9BACT|nr:hypothetical protein FTUN_6305 [Frigoriglobus tundricola]